MVGHEHTVADECRCGLGIGKGAAPGLTAASPAFPIKVGLFAFDAGSGPHVPARFDYVHVYSTNP